MAFQIDIYFDPGDMQTLVSGSPNGVLITCVSVPSEESAPALVALAIATNDQGRPVKVILGCPTPCKPGGSVGVNSCQPSSAALLDQLKTQIANPLEFLNLL